MSTEHAKRARTAEVTRAFSLTLGFGLTLHFTGRASVVLLDGGAAISSRPMKALSTYGFADQGITIECLTAAARVQVTGVFKWQTTRADADVCDLHAQLDSARVAAAASNGRGPVVIVVGRVDTGKSTLVNHLVSRALIPVEGRAAGPFGVIQVELDIGQASMACPGAVSACFLRAPLSPDDDHDGSVPLSFFFGDKTVRPASKDRYIDAVRDLRRSMENVFDRQKEFGPGGAVANTMGWVEGLGLELQKQAIDALRTTHIIVTGNDEKLLEEMRAVARASARGMQVLTYSVDKALLRSRTSQMRAAARDGRIRRYFCGAPHKPLTPARVLVTIASLLLLDAESFEPVAPRDIAPTTLCAVSNGTDAEQARHANVAGFIVVLDVGDTFLGVLAPATGPLPSRVVLVSRSIRMAARDVPAF
jgi:polyribonucleotide 5'-hydroxyl-kinase